MGMYAMTASWHHAFAVEPAPGVIIISLEWLRGFQNRAHPKSPAVLGSLVNLARSHHARDVTADLEI